MSSFVSLFNSSVGDFDQLFLRTDPTPGYVLECTDIDGAAKWSNLSTLVVSSIRGTADQVLVNGTTGTDETGDITLTLPQSVATSSSPSFQNLSVASNLTATTINGLISTSSQPDITELDGLAIIQGQSISPSVWQYVDSLNQNLSTVSSVNFNQITCGQINSTNIVANGPISINSAYVPGGVNYLSFRNAGAGRWVQGMINPELGGSSGSDYNIWSLSDSNVLNSALTITRSNQAVTIPGALNATLATASQPNITTLDGVTSLGGVSGVTVGGPLSGPSCSFSGSVSGLTGGFTNSVTTKNLNATVGITGGALTATTASLTGALTMNTNNISGVATLSANALIGGILWATSGNFTGPVSMNLNNLTSVNDISCISLSGVNLNGTTCDVTTLNAGAPVASGGAINANSAGVYSYNTATRYIRFNTNGGANDLMSAGSPLVINFSDNGAATPRDVEFFGLSNTGVSSSVNINGNLLIGNQGAFAVNSSPTRSIVVKAGPSQATTNMIAVTDALNNILLSSNLVSTTLNQPLRVNIVNDNTNGNITSGVFNPTMAVVTNLTSITVNSCNYSRIGNVFTISGSVNIQPSGNWAAYTVMVATINYPVSAPTTAVCNGTIGAALSFPFMFSGHLANNNASSCSFRVMCASAVSSASTYTVYFSGQYIIA
jgi:hypothetical protein